MSARLLVRGAIMAAVFVAAFVAPAAARAAPPPTTADLSEPPLVGDKDGLVFVRDRRDLVRLYPHAQLDLDGHAFLGSRVARIGEDEAGIDLGPRFFVRRARLDLAGELLERFAFDVGIDLAAQPSIDGARADGRSSRVALADAWGWADAGRGLHLVAGVFQAPLSLENRTATSDLPMMERNVAIRSFVVPGGKALGVLLGGATRREVYAWDVGVLGADTLTPGELERRFDATGRVTWSPFATRSADPFHALQMEIGGRVGARNLRDASDDAPAFTTGQGFPLWRPTRDDAGRTLHVIPSGLQWASGASFRLPIRSVVFRTEGFWVSRETRESVTARPGRLDGVGAYAEISSWILQTARLISGEPPRFGRFPHAEHLELARTTEKPERYGVELAVLGATIQARYQSDARPSEEIRIYQLGVAANYWHTRRFRLGVNGNLYATPASGGNTARVPGRLGDADPTASALWELGVRSTVMF